ncbi:MAG: hypothetical protein OJF60_001613 [Burkholderiaceae bacterium]|jgi:hypothetical protein|nr:MAG: hypothetical protein OJF60_001613 [Burkholderiaceae bacterium]
MMLGVRESSLICAIAAALMLLSTSAAAAPDPDSAACSNAWSSYNDFKSRTAMDPSQYPLTIQGAAVRAACGESALPAPPGADTPPRHILRRHPASKPEAPGAQGQPKVNPTSPLAPVPVVPRGAAPEHRRAT